MLVALVGMGWISKRDEGRFLVVVLLLRVDDNFVADFQVLQRRCRSALLELGLRGDQDGNCFGFFGDMMRFGSLLPDSPNVEKLARLAEATGGRAYFPKTMEQCKQACLDIAAELRHQYTLIYYPSNKKKDGTWRKIRVEVADLPGDRAGDLHVRAREGYYAPKE